MYSSFNRKNARSKRELMKSKACKALNLTWSNRMHIRIFGKVNLNEQATVVRYNTSVLINPPSGPILFKSEKKYIHCLEFLENFKKINFGEISFNQQTY